MAFAHYVNKQNTLYSRRLKNGNFIGRSGTIMAVGYIILALCALVFGTFGFFALKKWLKARPAFTYKNVEVRYITVEKTEQRDKAIKYYIYERVIQGHKLPKEEADIVYAAAYKKPKRTKEIDNAIKRGIDEMLPRIGYKVKGENVKLFMQPYPVSHEHPRAKDGILTAFGLSYPWNNEVYISIMPESRGGLKSVASLSLHEIGGHFTKYEEGYVNEDGSKNGDGEHKDEEFWKIVDAEVKL